MKVTKKQVKTITTNNILRMFENANMEEIRDGKGWYTEAHFSALQISCGTSYNLAAVCGMIAVLSPRNKWARNIIDVEKLILDSTAKVGTFHRNKEKALMIKSLINPSFENVLDILKGDKVSSFYANIYNPSLPDIVTIDSHAIGVWLGNRTIAASASGDAYQSIQADYVRTANQIGLVPCQLQAVTWLTYRRINNIQ